MKALLSDTSALVDSVSFDLVGTELGRDIQSSLETALSGGAIFAATTPLAIFRQALAASIRAIETHRRGTLFQDFLLKGPYEASGPIPPELTGERLSDADVALAIKFIYSYMVNCFKGAVAELLAAGACARLLHHLQEKGELPEEAQLFAGDTVGVHRKRGRGVLKGADFYVLIRDRGPDAVANVVVAAVVEVKSYFQPEQRLDEQLARHTRRSKEGFCAAGKEYPPERVRVGFGPGRRVLRVAVLPSHWRLPRAFRFEASPNGRWLHVEPGLPHRAEDEMALTGDDRWRVILRWSKEAIAQAAYEMTFWYMEQVGELIYAEGRPRGWEEMTAGEAGRNAAKMMLYYAILRCRSPRESQRAIALYNTYGFGYALGMSYRNAEGKREMLWPEDLDEILARGKTRDGGTIKGP